ncbi:MAG TPA: DUF222 domain-containing protein [Candidatus Dormibacteraeota bacterium]|nr:DUF222 domain-containing protein [Candidatus Dormibacteraeota bacterium]
MLQVLEPEWVDPEVDVVYRLEELRQHIDQMELAFAGLATELAKGELWDREGFNSAGDWLRFTCHMSSHAVSNALNVGREAPNLAKSIEAMNAGAIGFAHLATMARTADEVGKAFDESKLLPLALKHSPGKFHHKVLHYKHSVDAAGYNRDQERLVEERSLRLSTAQDGCLLIMGVLDPAGGAAVRSVLEPLAQPSGAHDDRNREQRLADALVERVSGGRPANIQVTATIETLKGLAGAAAGEMEFSLPLSSTSVQRMACDCSVTRVLLSQESVTIDVGRSRRVITGGLSRALKARDGHCRWPGCERSASMCDGHHVVHWIHGGPTDLDNLVLLCRRHHRMVHEGGWQLIQTDDRKIITVAPTISFGLPRGPD